MNYTNVIHSLRQLANAYEQLESSNPTPQPNEPEPTPYVPPTPTGEYQVLVMFSEKALKKKGAVDMNINGVWYNFSKDFQPNSHLQGVGSGVVFNIGKPVTHVEVRRDQINFKGLNNECFGYAHLKVMTKHPDANLFNLSTDGRSLSYWAHTHVKNGGNGALWDRRSQNFGTHKDDPKFYIKDIPASWSVSKKIMIMVNEYGLQHPGYSHIPTINPLPPC